MTNHIPNLRHKLPLVDNVGMVADKHGGRVVLREREELVYIADACRVLKSRPCLPAPFGTGELNGPKHTQEALNFGIHRPRKVPHGSHRFHGPTTGLSTKIDITV